MDELWQAYRRSTYRVFSQAGAIDLRIGDAFPPLFTAASSLTIITAWNPGSVLLSDAENRRQNENLRQAIRSRRVDFLEALGLPPREEAWQPEESFCVFSLSLLEAIELGSMYQQNAICFATLQTPLELHSCVSAGASDGEG